MVAVRDNEVARCGASITAPEPSARLAVQAEIMSDGLNLVFDFAARCSCPGGGLACSGAGNQYVTEVIRSPSLHGDEPDKVKVRL